MTHSAGKTDAEQDLLYGILAVQLGLVSPKQVMTAASEWAVDRSVGLAARLEQAGIVAKDRSAMIRSMVAEAVTAHGGDPRRTLDTFGGDRAVTESFGGSVVLSADGEIVSSQVLKPITADEVAAQGQIEADTLRVTPASSGRYSLRDRVAGRPTNITQAAEIGRGGIGRVLVAFDEHLGRQVAMKELLPVRIGGSLDKVRLRPEQSDGKGNGRVKPVMSVERVSAIVARFLREARVTGQLEHPNIVPVYELGRNADDTLYYTMKLVRGRTMAEALDVSRNLAGRLSLLGHFVDLCQALAYAHSRGVVHRDIKPDNVMLGEFGETVVLDWGLAKVRGIQDLRGSEIEREIQLLRDVTDGHTVDGTAVGTPAFMSPEQADGRLEEIDERSDVWSLGGVLYQILTGRPPYEGATAYEVIGRVLKDPVEPVRLVCPEAPPELASVCAKALTRERSGRYQGAKELADEVNSFLTGGRVNAYTYRLGDLLRRVVDRHRLSLSVGGISLLLLFWLGIWSYLRVVEDRDRAQALQAAADGARQDARLRMSEAHAEGARAAMMRRDLLEARAKLRSSLEVSDSVAARVLWGKVNDDPLIWKRVLGAIVYDVAYSPLGDEIAAAGHDGSVYLLDVNTSEVRVLRGHLPWVATLAYSADGSRLATAGSDKSIRLWDVQVGKLLATLEGHTAPINDLTFSPDASLLVSASHDCSIRLWRTATGELVQNLESPGILTWVLAFTPDGTRLIAGDRNDTIRAFALVDGRIEQRVQVPHPGGVAALDITRSGRWLATGGARREVNLWDLAALRPDATPVRVWRGHTDGIAELAFSPDGQMLVSGSYDETVRLWNMADPDQAPQLIREHTAWIAGAAFDPAGTRLVTAAEDRSVALWRLPYRPAHETTSHGHTDGVNEVAVSSAAGLVASGGVGHTVRLWDLDSGQERRVLTGHEEAVHGLAFLPDRSLISASWPKQVLRWGLEPGQLGDRAAVSISSDIDPSTSIRFGPTGRFAAVGAYDRTIRLWDLTSGTERKLSGHLDLVRELDLSPDERWLASASWDRSIRIWDTRSGQSTRIFADHPAEVGGVQFGPTGDFVIASCWDQTLRRWDLSSGQGQVIGRTGGRCESTVLSRDGSELACGREDGVIELWDLREDRFRLLRGHRDLVTALAFGQDGKTLASSSDDGTVRLWDTERGGPRWRAPLLLTRKNAPPLAWTHQGWIVPGAGPARVELAETAWLQAAQRARNVSLQLNTACLEMDDDVLELWDMPSDRLVLQRRISPIDQIQAFDGGCATRSSGEVALTYAQDSPRVIASGASALGWTGDRLLVAAGGQIQEFETSGLDRARLPADVGVTALARLDWKGAAWIAVGYSDGTVELTAEQADTARRNLSLKEVPSSQVVQIIVGPRGTLLLGYANGLLGIWDVQTGARLDSVQLHGPLAHAAQFQESIFLVTELGDHLAWDLSTFQTDYCSLLGDVWDRVPVVWTGGRPVTQPVPADHPCRSAPPATAAPAGP